jgi:hypothetical protein
MGNPYRLLYKCELVWRLYIETFISRFHSQPNIWWIHLHVNHYITWRPFSHVAIHCYWHPKFTTGWNMPSFTFPTINPSFSNSPIHSWCPHIGYSFGNWPTFTFFCYTVISIIHRKRCWFLPHSIVICFVFTHFCASSHYFSFLRHPSTTECS